VKPAAIFLICLAGTARAAIGVNSGLTSLYVSGNEIYVASASANSIRGFQFSAPFSLTKLNLAGATEQEPIFINISSPYVYVVNRRSATLQTLVSDDAFFLTMGSAPTGFDPTSGFFRSPYLFVTSAGSNFWQAFDVSCNSRPIVAAQVRTASIPTSISLDGKYAFVTCFGTKEDGSPGAGMFQSFDIGKLKCGVALSGSIETDAGPVASLVSSPNAYVVNFLANNLQSFNVSNPAALAKLGSVDTDSGPTALAGNGSLVYVACRLANAVDIFDVSDPAKPRLVQKLMTDFGPTSIVVQPPYAYVACFRTLQIFDVSDPLRVPPFLAASTPVD
jgi:hypothetical protein